jgi:hypothetical protein
VQELNRYRKELSRSMAAAGDTAPVAS